MKDQVQKLKSLGISVVTLSDIEEEDVKAVEKGVFSRLWKSRGAYTYGRCVAVQSDHKPLEMIFKKSLHKAPKRLQRMLMRT